ncbi:chromosome partitioning protein, ParB family [Thermosulfidibacter takaii ABI70S6]|uniref:Chromosome partitioning protein, ParB family n=1 Tax=Thermosulfidibacter takaii (strain DSM 17441 / JCM 13301 / NBRC 103674 / ABI70S6) TaxID=1298851 RepID=A0A0S3QTM1_THET7|nr:ParB/RepB/Spo0J family partition protein [Thermosulfidibacter takaii]BAT71674.1 chromosome partitioning protein, ParB family [Thermosulfidibacter takaii ABI70S6]
MRKGRLGRGLDALLGESSDKGVNYQIVSVEQLVPREGQPRLERDDIDELVESVKRHGILQPIIATKKDGKYLIVAGERRWIAAKQAGLSEVPVIVGTWDDRDIAVLSIVENVQRKNLSPLEEALYYEKLTKDFGLKQEEIASLTGKSRAHVANVMRILRLPEKVRRDIRTGKITLGHAKALLSLKDEELILQVLDRILKDNLSVRETEELVKQIKKEKKKQMVKVLTLKEHNLKAKIIYGKKISKIVITGNTDEIERFLINFES